jgi:hypothetical protein
MTSGGGEASASATVDEDQKDAETSDEVFESQKK